MAEEQTLNKNSEVEEEEGEGTATTCDDTEDLVKDGDQENTGSKDEKTPPKKGRGRPPKKKSSQNEPKVDQDEPVVKKGRGRPPKQVIPTPEKEEESDAEAEKEEASEKKGRGRPRKHDTVKEENVVAKEEKTGKKGRPKKHSTEEAGDTVETPAPKAKKPRIKKERSVSVYRTIGPLVSSPEPKAQIEPGKLRDTPRLSYKDESSDEEVDRYLEPGGHVSSDSEADFNLERRLSGKGRPEQKEAGALRARKRMSYKDDSDSESGFESDVISPKKQSKSPSNKGRGRPRKQGSEGKRKGKKRGRKRIHPETGPYVPTGNKRGRKRIHPDTGPYVPTGKPRGRPKGSKKVTAAQSEEGEDLEAVDKTGDQSESGEPTLTTPQQRETTIMTSDTDKSAENSAAELDNDSVSGEENNSERESMESAAESEPGEAGLGKTMRNAIEATVS